MKVCVKAHSHGVCMKTLCSLIFCPSGWDPAGQALVPFSPYFFIRQCWIPLPAGNEQFCFWKLAKKKKKRHNLHFDCLLAIHYGIHATTGLHSIYDTKEVHQPLQNQNRETYGSPWEQETFLFKMCFLSPLGLAEGSKAELFQLNQQVTRTAYLRQPNVYSALTYTEFLGPIGIITIAFALDISRAASIIHVVNTVFVMKEPTIILLGNNRRIKVVYFCFE